MANQDQWVEIAGKPILPPYKEELLNTLNCLNGMGCFQKSWVLHTEGNWTEATWLIAGNVQRTVLASDADFYKIVPALPPNPESQWKVALFLLQLP